MQNSELLKWFTMAVYGNPILPTLISRKIPKVPHCASTEFYFQDDPTKNSVKSISDIFSNL